MTGSTGTIIVVLIELMLFAYYFKTSRKSLKETLPSLIQTTGLIGTFMGISIALYNMNIADVESSIFVIFGGMKTAFVSSLVGLVLATFLRYLNSKHETDGIDLKIDYTKTLKDLQNDIKDARLEYEKIQVEIKASQTTFDTLLFKNKNILKELEDFDEVKSRRDSALRDIRIKKENLEDEVGRLKIQKQTIHNEIMEAKREKAGTEKDVDVDKSYKSLENKIDRLTKVINKKNINGKAKEFSFFKGLGIACTIATISYVIMTRI